MGEDVFHLHPLSELAPALRCLLASAQLPHELLIRMDVDAATLRTAGALLLERTLGADLGRELDRAPGVKGRTTSLGQRIFCRSQSSANSNLENLGPLRTGNALQKISSSGSRFWTSELFR